MSIARALDEDIPLIKIVNRLSRHIKCKDLTFTVGKCLADEAKRFTREDIVPALNMSDVSAYLKSIFSFVSKNATIRTGPGVVLSMHTGMTIGCYLISI